MEKFGISDSMRLFTLVVSASFVAIGVTAIASGNSDGWLIAGFFGLCFLIAVFEPWFPKPWAVRGRHVPNPVYIPSNRFSQPFWMFAGNFVIGHHQAIVADHPRP